jgi:hypothetical protein
VAEEPSTRWRLLDFVLVELIALALLSAFAVAIGGARALPWTTAAERDGARFQGASVAAERAVQAFLTVDYRDLDAEAGRVRALTTNPFRAQYSLNATDLRVAAVQARSVSRGTVRAVGVNQVAEDAASVLVAADTVVTSSRTKGRKATRDCPRDGASCGRHRFLVSLQRVDGRWLMADLAEAP